MPLTEATSNHSRQQDSLEIPSYLKLLPAQTIVDLYLGEDAGPAKGRDEEEDKNAVRVGLGNHSSLSAEAEFYANIGLPVLPVKSNSKAPLLVNGVSGASSDPAQVNEWWRRWPDANVGIALHDILIIDNDQPKHGGDLKATLGVSAPCVLTPSGGTHHYFSRPKNFLRKTSIDNIDFLTGNAYVLAPPSTIMSRPYSWIEGCPSSLVNLEYPPVALLDRLLVNKSHMMIQQLDLETIDNGERNDKLFSVGARLLYFGYPFELVFNIITAFSDCVPGELDQHEVHRIISSLSKYRNRQAKSLWDRPKRSLSILETEDVFAKIAGVLRGANCPEDLLTLAFGAVAKFAPRGSYLPTDRMIGDSIVKSMKYPMNYAHFLRRNGSADKGWGL